MSTNIFFYLLIKLLKYIYVIWIKLNQLFFLNIVWFLDIRFFIILAVLN